MTAATVSDVPVDPDLARRLATASRKAEEWRDRRDDLIREAARNGGTLREIAAVVGMSNPGVLRVIRRGPLETRHITPLHQGGSKDDPDNLRFVSPGHLMCPCGGELTVWCFDHGDWVCDDCGCYLCREEDAYEIEVGVVEQ